MQIPSLENNKLFLPRINFIELNGFAIYKKVGGKVKLNISKSVYCLAGANGLGKSTLLTTIIYGLCGHARRLGTQKVSLQKRKSEAEKQTDEYYLGRLKSEEIDNSSVDLEFTLGKYLYKVRRKIFKADGLESLIIKEKSSGLIIYNNDGTTPQKMELDYQNNVANHSNIGDFDRFTFLVQYVQSFDENHHLLFWDAEALENAIFTCIGLSSKLSKDTEDNRLKAQQLSSRIRNLQFAKKQTIEILKATYGLSKSVEIFDKEGAEALIKIQANIEDEIQSNEINIEAEKSVLAMHSHQKIKFENDYKEVFDIIASGCSHIPLLNNLQKSVELNSCFACGENSPSSIQIIQQKMNSGKCPICESDRSDAAKTSTNDNTERLKSIDNKISEIIFNISQSQSKISAYEKLIADKKLEFEKNEQHLKKIMPNSFMLDENKTIDGRIEEINRQISAIDSKKKEIEEQRNECEKEYKRCYRELEKKYISIENQFVPTFRELAQQFLGMPVDISLNKAKSVNSQKPMLSIAINGSSRSGNQQLSESQRFFVDIALKMSLINFCTGPEQDVSMLLDTPEGSLDLAYEEMVGDMFANFIGKNKSIFMTANLNSSEILKKLAYRCRSKDMEVERMLSWADLSEVQIKSESKFHKAYEEITKILNRNNEEHTNE